MQQKFQRLDLNLKVKSVDTVQGTFSGLGAAFGNLDYNGDIIDRGAFSKTLQAAQQQRHQSGTPVLWPLCWMHDRSNPVGSIIAARETTDGLAIDCQCDMDTEAGKAAFSGITKGYATGLSIGYYVTKASVGQDGCKHLLEIDLHEISVITTGYAANPRAQVDLSTVKSRKGNSVHNDDWKQQRLPRAPQRTAPLLPVMPEEEQFTNYGEYKSAMKAWFATAYGVEAEATRRVEYDNHSKLVTKRALDSHDIALNETEVVGYLNITSSRAERAEALEQAQDERACLPDANVTDMKAYLARHGRTPDGRVIQDYSNAVQRGYKAIEQLLADAREGR